MKKFYISTAIDYVNSFPHAGHALEKIQADVVARYHRFLGEKVFFLTGTDENSLKNVQSAEREGIPVKKMVDQNAKKFYQLKNTLNLSFDDFIRTTEGRHIKGAQKLWKMCKKDIYKKNYKGLYCVGCEEFYKENELKNGLCPEHKKKLEIVEEENYFFKLSQYQNQLKEIIEKDKVKIIPESRKNEILNFIEQGLEDICISRSIQRAKGWGIPVLEDPSQIQWCWFDALSNYITALNYDKDGKKFQEFWQENKNKLHIVGKGINRFHSLYWSAMLLSAKLSLPNTIFVHGYLTSNGQKMSKSLGNVIDPFKLVEKYGTDAVRYFLLREIPPTEDGDFTYEKFEQRYNSDLASGIGNFVARVNTMANKLKIKKLKIDLKFKIKNLKLKNKIRETKNSYRKNLENFKFNEALKVIWELVGFCDKYIEQEKPWEGKENSEKVLSDLSFAIDNIADLLEPFLPQTSKNIKKRKVPLFPRLR